ncbi:MAG: hypothetical protein IPJ68_00260 [Candidatus Moraniibacteriota bacterium]|nr:MAG: hypothetical protein IPJ68_00260 [Candidatus Moranbacteria bacterium]
MEKYSLQAAEDEALEIKKNATAISVSPDRGNAKKLLSSPRHEDYQSADEAFEDSRELRRFQLPEIYKMPESGRDVYLTLYDGTALLSELKRQRESLGGEARTPLAMSIFKSSYIGSAGKKTLLMKSATADYIPADNNTELVVFSSDNARLAEDIMAFFSDKLVRIATRADGIRTLKPNMTDALKEGVLRNLKTAEYEKSTVDPELRGYDEWSMDVQFSVYPGLAHSVRFGSTCNSQSSLERYPFIDVKNLPYAKQLWFSGGSDAQGYKNEVCDVATLLELNVFLKQRGHAPVLRLNENPGMSADLPDKKHYMYVV